MSLERQSLEPLHVERRLEDPLAESGGEVWDGLGRRVERLERRRRDDPFDAARQFRVQGYERVGLQLSECNVLGVVGRGPSQLIRQFPSPTPEYGIAKEPDGHPSDAC